MIFLKKLNQVNKEKLFKTIFFISLIIVTFNSLSYFFEKYVEGDRYIFFDLPLNYCAGKLFSNNISPYGFGLGKAPLIECVNNVIKGDWGMPVYIYSPIFLELLSVISKLDFNTLKKIWYFITVISVFSIIFFSYKILPIKNLKKFVPLIIFFSFGGIFVSALLSGNISILGYALICISLIFLHRKKLNIFSYFIIFLSLIKPHFFVFLLIGFFVYGNEYIKKLIFSLICIVFLYFVFFLLNTDIFFDFFNAIRATNTSEWFFSFNSTFGLMGIINNIPRIFNNPELNIYFSGGPSILNNIIWLSLISFIFLGFIYFRLSLKVKDLNDYNKSKLIALGTILVILINPNITSYDFLIFIPSVFYLVNEADISYKFKYFIMTLFILIQDINFPFFVASLIYFLVIISIIKNYDILNLNKK